MSSLKLKWHRLTHWEYWPFWLIYYPLFPVWLFFSLRARSFFFFNAANPTMENGGMAMESKNDIYEMIPQKNIPKTIWIGKGTSKSAIMELIKARAITFPFIAKPDIGMKALGVEKIHDEKALDGYIAKSPENFLIQEFIPYKKEVGIFYVRIPGEDKGRITGIVSKEFLAVIGDGESTVLKLIKQNPRSHMQLGVLKEQLGTKLNTIPAKGEEFILVPYGSHTRGAKFVDYSHYINEELVAKMNEICTQVPEFYYGRLDVLYNTMEELSRGESFSIIEINGAGGEPTHIYDPKHSIFFAWKEILRHWNLLNKISIINHKKGHPYLSFKDGRAMLKANDELESQLKLI
jgi:hypothetical protein